jgi:hypothetical protein
MRSRPRQFASFSINTGGQSSLWQTFSELQSNTCAHCSCPVYAQVWRRASVAVAAASKFWFSLGLSLGYGLDYLISSCLVRYLWGKVRYPLFGYLA